MENSNLFPISFINMGDSPPFQRSILNSIDSGKEKGKIINEITDLIKCYICLDTIKDPKMCYFCHRLACGECIRKWLIQKTTCGFCLNE